ncbi:MAG: hypothetical protein PUE37_05755 [Firmicutes bacterium]|nr:hypothetical protein [Bacillota bacterium]
MKIYDLRFLRNFLLLLAKLSLLPIKPLTNDKAKIFPIAAVCGACILSKKATTMITPAYAKPASSPFTFPPSLPNERAVIPQEIPAIMLITMSAAPVLASFSLPLCISADIAKSNIIVTAKPTITDTTIALPFIFTVFDDCKKIPPN